LKIVPGYLSKKGYRLPTEAEWEYACRAESATSRSYGNPDVLLDRYGWHVQNSGGRAWPVGQKRPNDFGLFVMHGNVAQWCHEPYWHYLRTIGRPFIDDREYVRDILDSNTLVARGGSFTFIPATARSGNRSGMRPSLRFNSSGMRVARTIE
jgi:formylglycine-generating enzyme required for sulfatase activity